MRCGTPPLYMMKGTSKIRMSLSEKWRQSTENWRNPWRKPMSTKVDETESSNMTTGEAPSTPKAVDRRLRRNIDRVSRRFKLRNGKQVGSRLLRPQDAPLLADFFYQL